MAKKIPSEFVPLDVNYAHDRAVVNAGPLAELLFVRSMAYAKRTRGSDGYIPDYDLPIAGRGIPQTAKHAAALVREGLWTVEPGGWRIRSWSKWNRTAAESAAEAEKKAAGAALTNHIRWHAERGVTDPRCDHCTDRTTDRTSDSGSDRSRSLEVEERRGRGEKSDGSPSSPNVAVGTQPRLRAIGLGGDA